ncbi:hypothetical protein BK661_28030 [Pseudomonas frederiksbergensis]|nr:hypothetical protein BK661_28030 [Pseudomonas frederiksbergensis]
MVWRGASHNDPGERWLRDRCSTFVAEQADSQIEPRKAPLHTNAVRQALTAASRNPSNRSTRSISA